MRSPWVILRLVFRISAIFIRVSRTSARQNDSSVFLCFRRYMEARTRLGACNLSVNKV
jgi:hypothetical protein